jgi:hypothetical protein
LIGSKAKDLKPWPWPLIYSAPNLCRLGPFCSDFGFCLFFLAFGFFFFFFEWFFFLGGFFLSGPVVEASKHRYIINIGIIVQIGPIFGNAEICIGIDIGFFWSTDTQLYFFG